MTDTDRVLLEKAAKAAGIKIIAKRPDGFTGILIDDGGDRVREWSPLLDDGDALRLAVKLQFRVDAGYCGCADVRGYMADATESIGADPYAATRRAIVRAAASMAGE